MACGTSVTSLWHFTQVDSMNRLGSIGKSQKWNECQSYFSCHSSAWGIESGLCEAKVKSVPEPWPPWQMVQPKALIGCGPLPSR